MKRRFKVWFDYYWTRHCLRNGRRLYLNIKVTNDSFLNHTSATEISKEVEKLEKQYNVKLEYSYDLAYVNDDFLYNIASIKITMKLITNKTKIKWI